MKFREWVCEVRQATYSNGRTALLLEDAKTGESVAVATVNLPHENLEPGQVFIKDYSENHGMLEALEKAGIVKATGETVHSGFAPVPKAILLSALKKDAKKIEASRTENVKDNDFER